MRRAVLLAVLLGSTGARAHDADVLFADVRSVPDGLEEVLTLTGGTLGQLAPIDADGDGVVSQADLDARAAAIVAGVWAQAPLTAAGVACARSDERAVLREGFVALSARLTCGPGELRQTFKVLQVLPSNYRVVLGSQIDGERGRATATGTFLTLTVPRPPPAEALDAARVRLGFDDGLASAFTLLNLCGLSLALCAARGLRGAAGQTAVWAGAGALGGAIAGVPWAGLLLLGVAGLGLTRGAEGRGAWAATAAGGLGAGLLLGGGGAARVLGLGLGVGLGALIAGLLVGPLAQVLRRKPRWLWGGRVLLALGLWGAVGFRLA
jgi:hypothetical protein